MFWREGRNSRGYHLLLPKRAHVVQLWCVNLNGLVVGDLLSRCPSLETLKLISCENIKYLQLYDLAKLKKFKLISIKDTDEVCSYTIEAPNLESLLF